jgi:hypothetical protein
MLGSILATSAEINWTEVGVLASIVGGIARWISGKLNAIGVHLAEQDEGRRLNGRRLRRIETHLGLEALPPEAE